MRVPGGCRPVTEAFLLSAPPPASWVYNGSILDVLSQYQNTDGGFGHALEPDFWNPLSSPMQTWAATEIIHALGLENGDHALVRGILSYLESTADFDGHTWSRTVAANDEHPHSDWWSRQPHSETTYNPTAALAGFGLRFSRSDSRVYQTCRRVAEEAFEALLGSASVEVHELSCYCRLFEYGERNPDLADLAKVERVLGTQVNAAITRDTSTWATGYVCRPSRFIRGRVSRWWAGNEDLVRYECGFLKETQLDDGSWPVNWHWSSFPEPWPVARDWWRSIIVIENLLFLKSLGE